MCIAVWVWQAHPVYQFLLLLNRDEFHDRPTDPVGWWGEGDQKILGGRDEMAGGTWLGCTKDGRVAFLTNVREPKSVPTPKTRGVLPLKFLQSKNTPMEIAAEIVTEADQYNGFNLILADLGSKTMVYVSNRPKEDAAIQIVSAGVHVLSNAKLDTPWPKVQRLRENFKELLRRYGDREIPAEEMVEELMGDKVKADADRLPNTGFSPEWELALSSIFVEADTAKGRYGTRSMAALFAKMDGEVSFYERYLENGEWKDHTVRFHTENME